MSEVPSLRIVPGAPPPAPLTKAQKKKRRAALAGANDHDIDSPITAVTNGHGHGLNSAVDAALVDHVPSAKDLNSSLLTKPEDMANAAIASETASEVASYLPLSSKRTTSPIVELVNKRHRTLHKKIQRIKEYSSKPIETLNDDQRRSLATLPQLEASSKEVEEVRKAIEVHEAEEAADEQRRLAEIEAIVKQRIADAVAQARTTAVSRTVQLVTLIRDLPELKEKSEGDASLDNLSAAIHGENQSQLETAVGLFVAGQGDYNTLVELLNKHLAPHSRTATPVEPEVEPEATPVVEEAPAPIAIGGIPSSAVMGGSYHFMQESELEPNTPFDEGAEWVEHPDASAILHNAPEGEPTDEDPSGKGHGAIDWAAEDHQDDLPPIAGLQEHFGASGQATPVAETPATGFGNEWGNTGGDGGSKEAKDEEDGFTTIPNKRGGHGTGDWRGGERGRGRGGFRGRGTGEWRSGSGGWERKEGEGHSGRGGYRGGDRGGDRGGERGRGDFRGRARGEWKPRGDYRGRGEGRGGFRGGRPPAEAQ